MGMMGAAKKTGHSISRCPTPIRLQYLQQYQLKWTSLSGLLANGAVMHFRFLFRESGDGRGSLFNRMIWVIAEVKDGFYFWVEYGGGHSFYSDCGFHDRGQRSVHRGESHRQGSGFIGFVLCGGHQGKECDKAGHHLFFQ